LFDRHALRPQQVFFTVQNLVGIDAVVSRIRLVCTANVCLCLV